MALALVTAPTSEPVTLAEAKAHLRVDFTDDDSLVNGLITVAREEAEAISNRAFVTQQWRLTLPGFPPTYLRSAAMPSWWLGPIPNDWYPDLPPYARDVELAKGRLQSVDSVTYVDPNGVTQTLSPTAYYVDKDSEPGVLRPVVGTDWPGTQDGNPQAVTVLFTAGYGDATTVPQTYKLAIKLLVAHWYENREPVIAGRGVQAVEVPQTVDQLLKRDRIYTFPT